jgi:hypothetical protein
MNVRLFLWDEISSQNIRDFLAAYNALDKFKRHIVIIQGDKNQIAPVIEFGTRQQIVQSSIYCSELITTFHKINFTINLRLILETMNQNSWLMRNYFKKLQMALISKIKV